MHWLPVLCALSSDMLAAPSGDPVAGRAVTAPASLKKAADSETLGDDPVQLAEVEVVARRGVARIAPEIELGAAEIDGLGAYDIGDAVSRIGFAQGFDAPPIVIINGRRVVNPRDFLGFPPDALVRVEVLPRAAAGLYGGDPARRVLNLVLQRDFESRDALLTAASPTAGGKSALVVDTRRSTIAGNDTSQFGVRASKDTSLRADERRSYSDDHPGTHGATLRPSSGAVAANLSLNRALGEWSASLGANARNQSDRSVSRTGGEAVEIRRRLGAVSLTGGLSGDLEGWSVRLGLDGQVSEAVQKGLTDSKTGNRSIAATLAADRGLFTLPAGPAVANLSGRVSHSQSVIDLVDGKTRRSADAADLRGTLSVPLSRSKPRSTENSSVSWGDSALALGATLRRATGAGGGAGLNGALSWSPVGTLRFSGAWSRYSDSPTSQQRFDPIYYGPSKVVFDFLTGRSVEILPILGGNAELKSQTTDQYSVAATVGPVTSWTLFGGVSFQGTDATDGIGALPAPTPAIEAAFPDRFRRDADGQLVSIDQRPINLSSALSQTLSSNLSFSIPIRGVAPPTAANVATLRVALTHTWKFKNVAIIREGFPTMDRLSGDGGGLPRQEIAVAVDGRKGRWVANATGRWRAAYRIRRDSGRNGPDDLRLSDFGAMDLKLGFMAGQRGRGGAAEGTGSRGGASVKLGLEIENLLDARPRARLGDGRPAPGYGADDQDPLGRVIRLTASSRF